MKKFNFTQYPKQCWQFICTKGLESEHQYIPLAILGIFGFVLYYLIWNTVIPNEYQNSILRIIGGMLCFFLLLKNYWPKWLLPILPVYWYMVLLYCFPFFFTFMLFKNPTSSVWLVTTMTGLFLMMLLVDWVALIILIALGVGLAWISYIMTTDVIETQIDFIKTLPSYLTVLIAGSIFIHRTESLQKAKLHAIQTLGSSIAHELRTPLASIDSAAAEVRGYLVSKTEMTEAKISQEELEEQIEALNAIASEAQFSNSVIDMLLMKVKQPNIAEKDFTNCSMNHCIEQALRRYPFDIDERGLVKYKMGNDFEFRGMEIFMIHVFFNLLKNALYHINKAGKGEVAIWIEAGEKNNRLYFKDTGTGVPTRYLPHLFTQFFSKSHRGTGLGLTFCKLVMESFGGSIICRSVEGESTEFVMNFPVIKSDIK